MKLIILILILLLMCVGAVFMLDRAINQDVQNTPKSCPSWLSDSPQAGCPKGEK